MPNKAPVQPTQFYVTPVGTPAGVQSFQSFAATLLAAGGGTGIGTQVVTDNFNRANEHPLAGNWTSCTFSAERLWLTGNIIVLDATPSNDAEAYWTSWASGNDQYAMVEVTAGGTAATSGVGPCVRHIAAAGTQTCYRVVLDASGNYDVQKMVAGAYTSLRSGTVSYAAGRKLGISAVGSSTTTIQIWYNGVQVGTNITDSSSPITSGNPGIGYSSTLAGSTMDNWEAGTSPPSGAPSAVLTKLPQKFLSATLSWIGSFAKVLNPGGTTFTKAFSAMLFGGGSGPGIPVGVPALIQHVASAMDVYGLNTMTFYLPNPALAGNCLILSVQFHSSGSISSISDDKSNTWTPGPTVTNATFSTTIALYYVTNVTAGTQFITIHFSGLTATAANQQACVSEFSGVALSSASDGSNGSSTSKTAGSITTTANGDLIYEYGAALSTISTTTAGGFNGTSITKGSGFTLLNADLQVGTVAQYQVQSALGAISPAFTTSGSATWGSVAIALKAAAAGTPMPAGVRVVHVQHTLLMSNRLQSRNANIVMQFPSTGNLLVGLWNGGFGPISAVTDGNSNPWSILTGTLGFSGNTGAQIVYAANATTGTDLGTITVTTPGTPTADSMFVLYDVQGVLSSPFDSSNVTTGNQTSTGPLSSGSITPTTSNGIVFHVNSIDFHTENAMTSPSGGTFDSFVNDLQDDDPPNSQNDVSPLDMDNAYAHYYNPDLSAITFTFTNAFHSGGTAGVLVWGAATAAFKGAPVATATLAKRIAKALGAKLFPSVYGATVVDDSNSTGNSADLMTTGGHQGVGQVYTSNGGKLVSSTFRSYANGAPTGNAYSKLYTVVGGSNAGTLLATSDPVDVTTWPNSSAFDAIFNFSGANQYILAAGTQYAISFEFHGTGGNVYFNFNNFDVHSGNLVVDDGSGFGPLVNYDLVFEVDVAPVLPEAALTRKLFKALSATLSWIGTFAKSFISGGGTLFTQSLTATLSFTGASLRRANKALTAALSFVGALAKRTSHGLAATLSFVGAMTTAAVHHFTQAFTATLSFIGTFSEKNVLTRFFTATLTSTAALSRSTTRALSATLSASASLIRRITRSLSATLSFTEGSMVKAIRDAGFSAALSFVGNLSTAAVHFFTRSFTAALSFVGNLTSVRLIQRIFVVTLSLQATLRGRTAKVFAATLSFSGQFRKALRKVFAAALSFVGFLFRGGAVTIIAGAVTRCFALLGISGGNTKVTKAGGTTNVERTK